MWKIHSKWRLKVRRFLSTLAFIFLAFYGLMFFVALNVFSEQENKSPFYFFVAPFGIGVLVCTIGFLTDGYNILMSCKLAAGGTILLCALQTFRRAYKPLSILPTFVYEQLQEPRGYLAKRISEDPVFTKMILSFISNPKNHEQTKAAPVIIPIAFAKSLANVKLPLTLFLMQYLLAIAISICLFGLLFRDLAYPENGFLDYVLASTLRFTGSDLLSVLNDQKVPPAVMACESLAAFFYFVLAILAFGMTGPQSALDFEDQLETLIKTEMYHFLSQTLSSEKPNQ